MGADCFFYECTVPERSDEIPACKFSRIVFILFSCQDDEDEERGARVRSVEDLFCEVAGGHAGEFEKNGNGRPEVLESTQAGQE